jgi:hypothetical protein
MSNNYKKIDAQIHQLSQTLAKFGRSFAEEKKDDSHTNLGLDYVGKQIWSRWAVMQNTTIALTLNLERQQFDVKNANHQTLASFALIHQSQEQVEQKLAKYLRSSFDADSNHFLKPLHFEIPDYSFKKHNNEKWKDEDVANWLNHRNQADQACLNLSKHLNTSVDSRIWPHHFDTGIYIEPTDKVGIGFGLAMADSMIDEPYYYFSAYGLKENVIDYNSAPGLRAGNWLINEHWKGAVLRINDATPPQLSAFLQDTTAWSMNI